MNSRLQDIATRPTPRDWMAYAVGFPMFACIAAIPPLLLLQFFYLKTSSGQAPVSAIVAGFAFGLCISSWFVRRSINRQCWRLTDSELIGGIRGQVRLPLTSIEKVIVGLPTNSMMAQKGSALLLVFNDATLLPLKLQAMPCGEELMSALMTKLKDRLIHDYSYSPEEIRMLRTADPNAVIRRK
jgi:hypothetical protein